MKKKNPTLKEILSKNRFRVTIFGSARIKPGEKEYEEVYNISKALGEKGIDMVTGGGPGVMKAASAGHKAGSRKTKTYTIGLGIKLPHEQRINPYVDVKKEFNRFSERLDNFMLLSNAVVVAHGGVGTMLELFFTWQLMQVRHQSYIPIILLGKQWKGLIDWLREEPLKRGFFAKEDLELLIYAKDYRHALRTINKVYSNYKKYTPKQESL